MPPVVIGAAAAAAISTGLAAAGLGALVAGSLIATFAASFGTSLVLGGLAYALSPKPKSPDLSGSAVSFRQPLAPWRVIYGQTRVGGMYAFIHFSDAPKTPFSPEFIRNGYMHVVLVLAGHEVEEIGDLYLDDKLVPLEVDNSDGSLVPTSASDYYNAPSLDRGKFLRVVKHLGTADQVADPLLMEAAPGKWTADHRLRGRAYVYIRFRYDPNKFPTGVPNPTFVVKGRKVYDPRTGLTAWSSNPALCLADYLTNASFGLGADYATEIDEAALIEAANVCDEAAPLAAGGTEARYAANGTFELDQSPKQIIEGLLTSTAGKAVLTGGKWRILAGAYRTPGADGLDESELRDGFKVQTRVSRRESFNAVKGSFISPANKYQPSDFPAVISATYAAEDNGETVYKDIQLPYTQSPSMAQRLGKIELLKARQQITTVWPCQLSAYRYQVGDVVPLTYARLGWSAKPFEVVGATLVPEEDGEGNVYLGVDLALRETAPNVYDWSASEEQPFDAAPDTNLPDPFTVEPPGAPEVTEALYETRDGSGVKAKAILIWAASADAFLREYQPEFKLTAASDWTPLPRTTATTAEVLDIAPGVYDFQVKAINTLGVSSAYSTVINREIYGLLAPPATPTGLSIAAISGIAILSWDRHPDLDVRMGGYIRIRHSPLLSGATWQGAIDVGPAVPGSAGNAALPLVSGTYLVKAFDSSGLPSATATSITTAAPNVLQFAKLDTLSEHPVFGGTTTDVIVVDNTLRLIGTGEVDDIADFDAVENLDYLGGIALAGTYEFAGGIDLLTVKSVRLGAIVGATVINTRDQIDQRVTQVDTWEDFDGTGASSAGVDLFVRTTDDDPAGAPTWSQWGRFFLGDHRARAFEFKAALFTDDPAYNIHIDELTVNVDELV